MDLSFLVEFKHTKVDLCNYAFGEWFPIKEWKWCKTIHIAQHSQTRKNTNVFFVSELFMYGCESRKHYIYSSQKNVLPLWTKNALCSLSFQFNLYVDVSTAIGLFQANGYSGKIISLMFTAYAFLQDYSWIGVRF